MAPPDMRCPSGDWRLSTGVIPILLTPQGAERRAAILEAWERLPEERRADPCWDCNNHNT
jgi:hypothetical protein